MDDTLNTYIVILKGMNKDLAITEFETLWKTYYDENISLKLIKNVLYKIETTQDLSLDSAILKRLTYTNFISKVLLKSENLDDIYAKAPELVKQYDGKKFRIRAKKSRLRFKVDFVTEKELAKPIWDSFEKPCVSIDNYDVEFNYIFVEDEKYIFFCVKLYENDKDYLRRMPKLRPVKMPYTLKSDMARVAINLLGIKSGIVLDPFCGIGGILLEAKDMGFGIIANDISWNDLKYLKQNFDHFFPNSNYVRTLCDSRNQFLKDNSIDGIVTDIPYGKSSRRLGEDLYEEFLKSAHKYLKAGSRMVVIYANFVEFRDLALKYFDEVCEIEEYINRSLTRYILVLERR